MQVLSIGSGIALSMSLIFLSVGKNGLLVVALCISLDVSSFAQKEAKFAASLVDFLLL